MLHLNQSVMQNTPENAACTQEIFADSYFKNRKTLFFWHTKNEKLCSLISPTLNSHKA